MAEDAVVDLEELIREARKLEPLPASATRLLEMSVSANIDLDDVVGVVELDPALAGSVLRMANSAMSAPNREITTVRDSVVRLGVDLVLSSAASQGIAKRMQNSDKGMQSELWRHSVAASMAANMIRRKAKTKIPAEVTAAALLHDIGKIVLDRYLNSEATEKIAAKIAERREENGGDRIEAEASVLLINHGGLGGVIAEHWKLPDGIVQAITHHHDPSVSTLPVVWATYLSEVVAYRITNDDAAAYAQDPNLIPAYEILGLSAGALPDIAEVVARDLDSVASALGVISNA